MPWREVSTMSERCEFVKLALAEGVSMTELCRRFHISPKTGYKWLQRFNADGVEGLVDRSRRPRRSPRRTGGRLERVVLAMRETHPAWGGRKIAALLRGRGHEDVPSPSTITAILRRRGCIDPAESPKHRAWHRFEHPVPNALWQMDFKGHFALSRTGRCHPLTVLDDHSRFSLGLQACSNETAVTVQQRLTCIFDRFGLPERMLMDNGSPWSGQEVTDNTQLGVWLMRLGIRVTHGRPYPPQTQGKDERFHRTLQAELLGRQTWPDLLSCQRAFDRWRDVYNLERPHEALSMAVPASRYRPSGRPFPAVLPPIDYGPDAIVRRVQGKGEIYFRGRVYRLGRAFIGHPVALRPTVRDGQWRVVFCQQALGAVNEHVNHAPALQRRNED